MHKSIIPNASNIFTNILAMTAIISVMVLYVDQNSSMESAPNITNRGTVFTSELDTLKKQVEYLSKSNHLFTSQKEISNLELSSIKDQLFALNIALESMEESITAASDITISSNHSNLLDEKSETNFNVTNTESLLLVEETMQLKLDTFEDTLAIESIDIEWGNLVNTTTNDTLALPEMQGITLKNQNCGSTLCMTEVSYDTATSNTNSVNNFFSAIGGNGPAYSEIDEETSQAIFYFAKAGNSLP